MKDLLIKKLIFNKKSNVRIHFLNDLRYIITFCFLLIAAYTVDESTALWLVIPLMICYLFSMGHSFECKRVAVDRKKKVVCNLLIRGTSIHLYFWIQLVLAPPPPSTNRPTRLDILLDEDDDTCAL